MSHRKPSWTYYYPRERDATIGFPKSSKRCRATVLLLLILCCTTLRATIASALAGRRSPLYRTTTTTAAAHGRPPADTQTKTEKRGTKSSAPIALSFIHDWDTSVDNQSLNWEEYYWWYIIYPEILNCVKKLCVLVIPFKSLGNCQSQVITTKLETSPFPLKKLTIEYKILQKWVWNGFWVGPFWHFWLPTVKVRWHIF